MDKQKFFNKVDEITRKCKARGIWPLPDIFEDQEDADEFSDGLRAWGKEVLLSKLTHNGFQGNPELPWGLAPSLLHEWGIKIPTSLMLTLPDEILLDEYFGLCYDPEREVSRFNPGFKKKLLSRLKGKFEIDDLMTIYAPFVSTASMADMAKIVGDEELKNWWMQSTDEDWNDIMGYAGEWLIQEATDMYGPRPKRSSLKTAENTGKFRFPNKEAFIQWVELASTKDYGMGYIYHNSYKEDLEDLENSLRAFGLEAAKQYYNKYSKFPWALAPSVLENANIKLPSLIILSMPVEELIDEYFGICYDRSRLNNRFQAGFFKRLVSKIKASNITAEELITNYEPFVSLVNSLEELETILPTGAFEQAWKSSRKFRQGIDRIFEEDIIEEIYSKYGEPQRE